jgi:hypothetical protein
MKQQQQIFGLITLVIFLMSVLPIGPVSASIQSEDKIEPFNINPTSGRWDVDQTGSPTISTQYGKLHLVGSDYGSVNAVNISRALSSYSDNVKLRYTATYSAVGTTNGFAITNADKEPIFRLNFDYGGGVSTQTLNLRIEYKMMNDTWYAYPIRTTNFTVNHFFEFGVKFNTLKSELTVSYNDNLGSGKYDFEDDVVVQEDIYLFNLDKFPRVAFLCTPSPFTTRDYYVDWIEADFSEREWKQSVIPSDTDVVVDTPFQFKSDGVISDQSTYDLYTDRLDAFSLKMLLEIEDGTNLATNDWVSVAVGISGLDEDGTKDALWYNQIIFTDEGSGNLIRSANFDLVNDENVTQTTAVTTRTTVESAVSVVTSDSRSVIKTTTMQNTASGTDDTVYSTVTDTFTNTAEYNEYLIQIFYYLDISVANAVDMQILDFSLTNKDIFADIFSAGTDLTDTLFAPFKWFADFLGGVFQGIINVLGGWFDVVFSSLLDLGTTIVNGITSGLDTLSDTLTNALTTLQSGLEDALDLVTSAVDDLASDLAGFVDDIIAEIIAVSTDLVDAVIDSASDLLDAGMEAFESAVGTAVSFLQDGFGMLVDLVDWIFVAIGITTLLNSIGTIWDTTSGSVDQLGSFLVTLVDFVLDVYFAVRLFIVPLLWTPVILPAVLGSDYDSPAVPIEVMTKIFNNANYAFPAFSALGFSLEIRYFYILIPVTLNTIVLGFIPL